MSRKPALWFFDLDNTLHHASPHVFPAIHTNMNRFIARTLAVDGVDADLETVDAARTAYWQKYGATLLGMVRHHAVAPEDFLKAAHAFDDLAALLIFTRGLRHLLRSLPGRKILLTNAPFEYSRQVMRFLRIAPLFDDHVSIESMYVHSQLLPKPSLKLMRRLMAQAGAPAHRCVLVEDTVGNLRPAHRLGMKTVWVTGYLPQGRDARGAVRPGLRAAARRPRFVDVRLASVGQLLRQRRFR